MEEAYFELKGTRWAFRAGRLLTLPLQEAIGPDGAYVARSRWSRGRLPLPEGPSARLSSD